MTDDTLAATRRSLHAIAELLIAGPQYRQHKTIRLAVTPAGIGGTVLPIRVEGADLVWADGRTPLTGTCRELAALAGVEPGVAENLYKDTSGVSLDDPLSVDPAAAALVLGWFAMGDKALRAFAPEQEPILWPEHFDLGIAFDDVNYGISPGDTGHPAPYAYVGPWTTQTGPFWNASFGAARSVDDLPTVESIAEFFEEGKAAVNRV
ncbi:hypothetical protein [Antrihabitans sp. YC2-6]|uniref:hypothetical protein n=1 Tax=Antrihabitans sp. YC2-6 TaxID=2799498 RepID=UPI0018F55D4E|nr:hypothetical protein [Antrihabitans sp. YC2-6]MBJ8345390.1 hypothetical protein [Antrihabitans sp. YC2-6]